MLVIEMLKNQSKLKLLLCINVMIMRKISSFVSNFSFGKKIGQLITVEIVILFIFI